MFVIVCVVFFMQDRPVLAMAVLVPVVLLTGFMFYYEISSARERAREEQRQNEKRRRDLEHKRRQLTDLDQRIEAKLREVDAIKAHLKVGP
ncbi:hypothetical protein HS125_09610 [bacterium]|nr:hypothetical protein [bacterium]